MKEPVPASACVVPLPLRPSALPALHGPSLAGRYHPPRLLQALVPHPQLADVLGEERGVVVLLTGPPGSGKTSALAALHGQWAALSAAVRWLTLGEDDNDPAVLRRHLQQAFAPAPMSQDPAGAAEEEPVVPPGMACFLDGLDILVHAQARAEAERFLLSLPPSSSMLVGTLSLQGVVLQEARLRGLVRMVGPEFLRMNEAQATALLGPGWTPMEVERLNRCVDGWAAGLRFLARAPEVARRWLESPEGGAAVPAEMADYFEDALCARMAPELLAVLMDASVLMHFTPELLAVLPPVPEYPEPQRWPWVEAQIRRGMFLRYADEERHWVVVHPALGRYLRQRLCRWRPARHDELQRFAATWFARHGHAAEAVRHAAAMADKTMAAQIIETAGAISVDAGNGPDVELGTYLPAERAGALPLLFLAQVYHRIRHGKLHEARAALAAARAHTQGFTQLHAGGDSTAVRAWAHMLEVTCCVTADLQVRDAQIATLEADLQQHLETQPVLAVSLASVLAFVYSDLSRHAEAATICSMGLHAQRAAQADKALLFLRIHQASSALARESVGTAVLCIEEAQRLASIEGHSLSYEVLTTRIMRAVLHYESNEIERAWELLWPALKQLKTINGWCRLYAEGFSTAVAIAGRLEGLEAAESIVRAGEDFARERDLPRLGCFLAIARLQQLRRAGEWRAAQALVEAQPLASLLASNSCEAYALVQQVPALLEVAHWMLDLGRPREAMEWLDRINRDFLEEADSRLRFGFRVLAMRASQGLRRYNAAAGHMRVAVDIARHTGLVLRALQERRHLLKVLDWAICHGRDMEGWSERARTWVDDTLRHATGSESAQTLQQRGRSHGAAPAAQNLVLSPRESEIVALIAEGCINKEIGARLGIAEGTVKTHRKKIHEKLGIRNRSQLILRARALLII